jgi:hypothetical protein
MIRELTRRDGAWGMGRGAWGVGRGGWGIGRVFFWSETGERFLGSILKIMIFCECNDRLRPDICKNLKTLLTKNFQ